MFDGGELWAADRALRAMHHGILVDSMRQSASYAHRLLKYVVRYSLPIVDPCLDDRFYRLAGSLFEVFESQALRDAQLSVGQWQGAVKLLLL